MHIRSFTLAAATVTAAALASAQSPNPSCQDPAFVGAAQQYGAACQAIADAFVYASQQYALLLAGGNLELGKADALGKFPTFRVSARAQAMSLAAPAVRASGFPSGPVGAPGTIDTQDSDFGLFSAEGAIGLFRGIDLGVGTFGALDAYASINIMPGTSAAGYTVTPNQKFFIGWGARVGVLQEGKVLPGVGFSYVQRNIPQSYVVESDLSGTSFLYLYNLKVDSRAWTVTVGKHFDVLSIVLGGGQTSFTSNASMSYSINLVNPTTQAPISGSGTQTQYFGDVGLDLEVFQVAFELGTAKGSGLTTYNSFDPSATASRSFAALGFIFGHH